MKYCEVCGGRRFIRLPLRRHQSIWAFDPAVGVAPGIEAAGHRDFPCPECSERVPIDRVQIMEMRADRVADINDPRFIKATRQHLAIKIGVDLHERGIIAYEQGQHDILTDTYPIRAVLGVVRPEIVATMEQRIAARQEEMAVEVIERAAAAIGHWGPLDIPKATAVRELRAAFESAKAHRAAQHKVHP